MTDQALTNGVYLQPLSRKETVAEMATIVAESYLNHQQYEQAIAMADLILEYYSKDVGTMVLKGTAYGRLGRQTLAEKFPPPAVIPDSYRGYFAYLAQNNSGWFSKAEALGWREETREDEGKYLRRVDQARQRSTAN